MKRVLRSTIIFILEHPILVLGSSILLSIPTSSFWLSLTLVILTSGFISANQLDNLRNWRPYLADRAANISDFYAGAQGGKRLWQTGFFATLVVVSLAKNVSRSNEPIHYNQETRKVTPQESTADDRKTLREFTKLGNELIFKNGPTVVPDKMTLRSYCGNEKGTLLGCYLPQDRGIYVLNVKHKKLEGLALSTLAHEMLHAGYEKLSYQEKTSVNAMLLEYLNSTEEKSVLVGIQPYKAEKADRYMNELHSIVGTLASSLPPNLEQYYSRYFNDRIDLVKYTEPANSYFTESTAKVSNLIATSESLIIKINTAQQLYDNEYKSLTEERRNLEALSRENTSPAMQSLIEAYNKKVAKQETLRKQIKSLSKQYQSNLAKIKSHMSESKEISDLLALNSEAQ